MNPGAALHRIEERLRERGCCSNGHGQYQCPAHEDHNPSLSVNQGERGAVVHCHAGCSVDEILAALELEARNLFDGETETERQPQQRARARERAPQIEELGPATSAQIARLKASRRLRDGDTLDRVGGKALSVRWPKDEKDWWPWGEWLGLPTLFDGGFKAWALNRNGIPRLDDHGKLNRRNLGPVSLLASQALRDGNGSPVARLWGVEGESDFLAAVEAGVPHVIASSGGASSLAGQKRHRDWLLSREPKEVVIVRDLDEAGRSGAEKAAQWWAAQGVPARILELPEQLGEGGDLRDCVNGRPARDGRPAEEPLRDAADLGAMADAARRIEPKQAKPPSEWEALIPFEDAMPVPFPTDTLSGWAAEWVRAEAAAHQVPEDLPAILMITACSAAVAGRARVEVKPGYREPLNLFTVVALPPASRKTTTFADATRPQRDLEIELRDVARPKVARAQEELALLRERAIRARKAAAKEGEDQAEHQAEAASLAEQIAEAEHEAPTFPRLVCDDVTPEALGALLEKHRGVMALFSPEGGELFEIARGRYSPNARVNLSVLLNGHAGDTIRVDRMKREPIFVENPALTICLTVQPSVIQGLSDTREFRGRGLLGRFLYSMPRSPLGTRDSRSPSVRPEIAESYARNLQRLLRLPLVDRATPLEPKAAELWFAFADEIEPRLAEHGDLGQMGDWAGKLCGAVARLAGVLHAMEWADQADPFEHPIEALAIERAIRLGRYFIEHARLAFALMGADDEMELAHRVWAWIRDEGRPEVSKRDVFQHFKGGLIKKVAELEAPLGVLVEHNHLRRKPLSDEEKRRPGRKSEVYEINPEVLAS